MAPTFTLRNYTVTPVTPFSNAVGGPGLTISPATPQTVVAGSTVQFTFTPALFYYYVFPPVGGTCPQGTLTPYSDPTTEDTYYIYTTGPITNDCTVAPDFENLG
ncbi:MAG: hypothetical protein ACD_41C00076G0002 [uncultured bacterium]|nr:MAG: hypothetical protein ACD_41C00076G0002 [uncultured bacterium]